MFLELNDVIKSYGTNENYVQVLKKISTKIEKGTISVILGPSGSGKSTFLNVIGGLDKIDSGQILIDGLEINKLNKKNITKYRRDYLGFVFQFYNLIPNLTLRENIEVSQYLSSEPLDIDEILKVLNIYEFQDKYPSQVSGGQQQRCSVARAIVKNPKILLCDEPTGALDYKSSKEMLVLFEKINQMYGTTILIITHNEEIKKMADKIIVLKDGIIKEDFDNEKIPAKEIEW
ncbi:ABC transporter ATP-binding protein [Oceanivirga salmonicida]|uniref:ABC transporter ATP-binding protein n=1 Tax=Oceanivirga salmonicida TaxID=1769291 RepID=UPI000835A487|nr:ABC transporter ATP-binding protein [Oceanivirga salmonicida]